MTKRIAIFIPTIKPGGAEKQAALLAIHLSKKHQVHFVAFFGHLEESPIVRRILVEANVNVIYIEGGVINKSRQYYKFLKENKIEICFNYISQCDIIGSFIEKLAGVDKIFNGIRNCKLPLIKLIGEWFAHNFVADYTIYNCYSGARNFEAKGFSKSKTIIIPNCFLDISEPIKHEIREKKQIITVARFQPQKDYKTSIRAIAEIKKTRHDFEFVIIGHGYLEPKIRQWVKFYGIENCTTIYVAPDNVQEILKSADIYLSTSLFEGTSNSIMEAMNWSLPVVATNVGDNDQLVKHDWNGFITPVGDYRTIALYIIRLIQDDCLRREMGLRGNERLHNYSEERFIENYSRLLEK